jgi:hypothetical protein
MQARQSDNTLTTITVRRLLPNAHTYLAAAAKYSATAVEMAASTEVARALRSSLSPVSASYTLMYLSHEQGSGSTDQCR